MQELIGTLTDINLATHRVVFYSVRLGTSILLIFGQKFLSSDHYYVVIVT